MTLRKGQHLFNEIAKLHILDDHKCTMNKDRMDFKEISTQKAERVFEVLASGPHGLSRQEAAKRLAQQGPNSFGIRRLPWFDIILRQFRSSFVYLLFFAAAIAFLLGQYTDAVLIFLFLTINFIQQTF